MTELQVHSFDRDHAITSDVVERAARDLASEMPNHMLGNYLSVKPHVLASSQFVTLMSRGDTYVGLASGNLCSRGDLEFFYIETLLLSESLHDQRVSYLQVASLFSCFHRAQGRMPRIVASKTYNGRAYVLVRKLATLVGAPFYPVIPGDSPPELEARARQIAEVVSPGLGFDSRRGIVRGGGGSVSEKFWPEIPQTRDPDINHFFHAEMTPSDRVLCVIDTASEGAQARMVEIFVEGRLG